MTPDVNVLVAAARDDHPHHGVARSWLEQGVNDPGRACTLMPMVVASFLRLVTSPRIFRRPSSIESAIGFVDDLLALPRVDMPALGPEWDRYRQLCLEKSLSGNDLPDAWLAAAVSQQGEHLVTFDKGLRRLLSRTQLTVLRGVADR